MLTRRSLSLMSWFKIGHRKCLWPHIFVPSILLFLISARVVRSDAKTTRDELFLDNIISHKTNLKKFMLLFSWKQYTHMCVCASAIIKSRRRKHTEIRKKFNFWNKKWERGCCERNGADSSSGQIHVTATHFYIVFFWEGAFVTICFLLLLYRSFVRLVLLRFLDLLLVHVLLFIGRSLMLCSCYIRLGFVCTE